MTIDQLFNQAFNRARSPRSDEYKEGVRAILAHWLHHVRCESPYPVGSAQADAFFAGVDEGHVIWREWNDRQAGIEAHIDTCVERAATETVAA